MICQWPNYCRQFDTFHLAYQNKPWKMKLDFFLNWKYFCFAEKKIFYLKQYLVDFFYTVKKNIHGKEVKL